MKQTKELRVSETTWSVIVNGAYHLYKANAAGIVAAIATLRHHGLVWDVRLDTTDGFVVPLAKQETPYHSFTGGGLATLLNKVS